MYCFAAWKTCLSLYSGTTNPRGLSKFVTQHYIDVASLCGSLESGTYSLNYYVDKPGFETTGTAAPDPRDPEMTTTLTEETNNNKMGTPQKIKVESGN
ncbi:hypothetical protein K6119_17030 [Paracrocinitomix mangrovi]|uniref:hypothetical protein n=1 Tax=Paracrocinitomix mangrovi TaxID=2862509 RepID=UPI001C8D24F1|nr:hypothetical protein [Paracrocinitomix mangrovi]UKN01431.1 hypothetical protein K6119_17030 [Paracrocinitomix mangrovi]